MPRNEALLRKFVEELSAFQIGQELMSVLSPVESDTSDSSGNSSDSNDDQWDEEDVFVRKVLSIFERLNTLPVEIRRPYQQPGVTATHCNSISIGNFDAKFPPGAARLILRFAKEDIVTLVSLLRLPPTFNCAGNIISSFEAFVLFLRRLAYPGICLLFTYYVSLWILEIKLIKSRMIHRKIHRSNGGSRSISASYFSYL